MKKRLLLLAAATLLSITTHAQSVNITDWNFDNLALGANGSPGASDGIGTASALNITAASVVGLPGSSTGSTIGTNGWNSGVTGWSTNAPIGMQGAQFAVSTFGFYQIQVSFDVYATTDAEANLQVQFTTDGHIWNNATIASVGTLGVIASNFATNSTVMGSYVILTNNGTTGWNNQVKVNLSGLSGVDNNPNFAIRMVNASTGTNCVTTTGAHFNNTSGSWTFDNVVVQGVSFDTIADWTFEGVYPNPSFVPNPVPEVSVGNTTFVQALGFNVPSSYEFANGVFGSTNAPDILSQPGSSTPSASNCWRVRGQGPGNGWNTSAPVGTQGGEFDVSTVNYSNILVSFDLYFTSQAEAKMCVLYTTDGWITTNVANSFFYGANPTFMLTNSDPTDPNYPYTVSGTYFYQNTGQNWYNNMIVDFTGVANVDNNPNFGFSVVNAATGQACVNYSGGSYNNSSGNCRFDNVAVSGQFKGSAAPALTNALNATVDHPFTNTFADSLAWRTAINAVFVNNTLLPASAYNVSTPGEIIFTPSTNAPVLTVAGIDYIVVNAANFGSAKVTQPVGAGAVTKLTLSQPAAPSASGGTLVANPAVSLSDKYGNFTTNGFPTFAVTAAANTNFWVLGGTTNPAVANGSVTFTNLSATSTNSAAIKNAFIQFTVSGFGATFKTNSSTFNIGAGPVPFTAGNLAVLQIDSVANNTTFSILELKPAAVKQSAAVNIVPISATAGTNSQRLASAGTCGKLSLSDDGTLISFDAFSDGSSATPDETLNLNRAVGTLNYTNLFTSPVSYVSTSLGGSQARSCATEDGMNYVICDKGGLYVNNFLFYALNNVTTRYFGGNAYVETAKTTAGVPVGAFYGFTPDFDPDQYGSSQFVLPNNFPADSVANDFYMISTNGNTGTSYTILYILDQVSSSLGYINKYSLQADGETWNPIGSYTNLDGGDTLFATTNGSGAVYLYYANGGGGTAGNSLVRLTDAGGVNGPLNITDSTILYTASKATSIEGVTFVPQKTANAIELIPPPILTPQTYAPTNNSASFAVTNTPDDPAWRSAITGITVNGSALPAMAYDTTQAGQIVFLPANSALLGQGTKTIVISATGYSIDSVVQNIVGVSTKLALTTQPAAPAADGGLLAKQPVVVFEDSSNNVVNSGSAAVTSAANQGTWTLGGVTSITAINGTAAFTNLTAYSTHVDTGGTNSVNAATIGFASGGVTSVTNTAFAIPLPIHSILGGAVVSGGTNLFFSFTNATALSFSVHGTNNLGPMPWPFIGPTVENPAGSGMYQFTDPNPATNSMFYYYLSQP